MPDFNDPNALKEIGKEYFRADLVSEKTYG